MTELDETRQQRIRGEVGKIVEAQSLMRRCLRRGQAGPDLWRIPLPSMEENGERYLAPGIVSDSVTTGCSDEHLIGAASAAILRDEDTSFMKLLERAGTSINGQTTSDEVTPAFLSPIRYQVERHRLIMDKFLISREDVRRWNGVLELNSWHDPTPELAAGGLHGRSLGAHVISEALCAPLVVPRGTIWALTFPDYLGEFLATDVVVSDVLDSAGTPCGLKASWTYGAGIANSRGVALGHLVEPLRA